MGRTNPTFRDQVRAVERRWQPFQRALRRRDRNAFDRLRRFVSEIESGTVDPAELTIEPRVSKRRGAYDRETRTTAALERAAVAGVDVHPGQSVGYVVVDEDRSGRERVRLPDEVAGYDTGFYRDRLVRAATSVLAPVGWRRGNVEGYLASRTNASLAGFGRH